jgi:hypothetical protein
VQTFKSFEEVLCEINDQNIDRIALDLFRFQAESNPLYKSFIAHSGRGKATSPENIPFLPISFFKTHEVKSGDWTPEVTFLSSGTTGIVTSRHAVKDLNFYRENAERIFKQFFGPLEDYHVLAMLPSYLERDGSSLVSMVDYFIRQSGSPHSGFYLNNHEELVTKLTELRSHAKRVILLGVTFALLELAEQYPMDLSHCLILETGGMKGKRKEIVREDLHLFLRERFNVPFILSEYGMTELLSQAYSLGNGKFQTPPTMKVLIRDINDPFQVELPGKTGGINIIDLANIHTCAFIETEDIGRLNQDGSFEVLGRMDNSDIRGCNLLVG